LQPSQYIGGSPAIPAYDGITKEEAEKRTAELNKDCNDKNPGFFCNLHIAETPPHPAIPEKPGEKVITKEGATKSEYEMCLRHNGL